MPPLRHRWFVPWSPTWQLPRDARLDPYRDRVAGLIRNGEIVGHVLILTEHYTTQTGGHLWWRRWAPYREVATPHAKMLDGSLYDSPIHDDDLDTELEYWSRGEFPLLGGLLRMQWLCLDEALEVAPSLFGVVGCLDNDGRVMWNFPG